MIRDWTATIALTLAMSAAACASPRATQIPAPKLPAAVTVASSATAPAPPHPSYAALASRIVGEAAAVREGDTVLVTGTVDDASLMEELAVEIRRRGAFALLSLTSDSLGRRYYTDVPEKYDTQAPVLDLKLASFLSAEIDLVPESDEFYVGVAPSRIERVFASRGALHRLESKRGIRQVAVGNEVYPSAERARRYAIPLETLKSNYWGGLSLGPHDLRAIADPMRRAVASGQTLEIENANGTHLTMSVVGRPVLVNDGSVSADRLAKGQGSTVWLPAGEIFLAPIDGTAEGTLVIDHMLFQDTKVEGLTIRFVKGKAVEMHARAGLEGIREMYDAAGAGRDSFSAVDIGLNPKVHYSKESWLPPSVASGMVSLGIGMNLWAGGTNAVPFGIVMPLPDSTVKIDGKVLVDRGVVQP